MSTSLEKEGAAVANRLQHRKGVIKWTEWYATAA